MNIDVNVKPLVSKGSKIQKDLAKVRVTVGGTVFNCMLTVEPQILNDEDFLRSADKLLFVLGDLDVVVDLDAVSKRFPKVVAEWGEFINARSISLQGLMATMMQEELYGEVL